MRIASSKASDQSRSRFGKAMAQRRVLGHQDLRHALNVRGGRTGSRSRSPGAEHGDLAERLGGIHRLGGGIQYQFAVIHFAQQKNRHHTAPLSLSFATSVSTSGTTSPARRASGSAVFTSSSRGLTSMP